MGEGYKINGQMEMGIEVAFKVTHCIYDLRDQYNNLLNCPVLEKIGEAVKVDMPKYCEVCPMRIASLGPPFRWTWVGGRLWVGKWPFLNPDKGRCRECKKPKLAGIARYSLESNLGQDRMGGGAMPSIPKRSDRQASGMNSSFGLWNSSVAFRSHIPFSLALSLRSSIGREA